MSARKLMFWGSEQISHSLTQRNSIDRQRSWLKLGRDAQTVVVKLCHKHSPGSIMHARFQEGNQTHTIHDRPTLTCQPQGFSLHGPWNSHLQIRFYWKERARVFWDSDSSSTFLIMRGGGWGWGGWYWHNRKGICCRRTNRCGRGDCSLSETCVEVRSMEWVWEHDYFCMCHRSG